jgi:hypothetical protein
LAGLLHHSDQGCTYASEDYQAVLEANGITCSMSRRGNCYDNAVNRYSVPSSTARRFSRIRLSPCRICRDPFADSFGRGLYDPPHTTKSQLGDAAAALTR